MTFSTYNPNMFKYNIYYKIQYFNPVSLTWLDLQKAFDSIPEAVAFADKTKQSRIMCINPFNKTREVIAPPYS